MRAVKFVFSFCVLPLVAYTQDDKCAVLYKEYIEEYSQLRVPPTELSYQTNFLNIQSEDELRKQDIFVKRFSARLSSLDQSKLSIEHKIRFKHLKYEIAHQQDRLALELAWINSSREIPSNGLHSLPNYKEWYCYYVKHFTGLEISPDEVFKLGESEVKKAKLEIEALKHTLGYVDDQTFYKDLEDTRFFSGSKKQILNFFAGIDSTVRKN